jgi:CDP-diacylglycerol--serine O-phosphatidyltransferase
MTAIRFAFLGDWRMAVFCIIAAGILDGLDGRMARLLKGASPFGAELDSLSDFVSFGVAPAVMIYLWSLQSVKGLGWAVALLFGICCAYRLARFNTKLGADDLPHFAYNYFQGAPAPAGAGLAIMPMMLSFVVDSAWVSDPLFVAPWMLAVAALMASTVPTYSMKRVKIPQNYVLPTLLFMGLLTAGLASAPWPTLLVVGALYIVSMPFSVRSYMRLRREAEKLQAAEEEGAEPAVTRLHDGGAPRAASGDRGGDG